MRAGARCCSSPRAAIRIVSSTSTIGLSRRSPRTSTPTSGVSLYARSLDAVVVRVRDLPRAREAALFLAGDVDLAFRLYALGLLAEELAG